MSENKSFPEIMAEISAAVDKAKGWQPIETAPMDGTIVLLLFGDGEACSARNFGGQLKGHNGWQSYDGTDFGYGYSNPTHWMRMPPHPSSLKE